MNRIAALLMSAALAATAACHAAPARPMSTPASTDLRERLERDFAARTDRPIAAKRPVRSADGTWRSPDGQPVVDAGIIGWTRPPQVDGAPFRAYWCEAEHRYWVHQESALGSTEFWFGPFSLAP